MKILSVVYVRIVILLLTIIIIYVILYWIQ